MNAEYITQIRNKLIASKSVLAMLSQGKNVSKKFIKKTQRNLNVAVELLKNIEERAMIVTAWNNSKRHSIDAYYGIKISAIDRKKYFNKKWKYVRLKLQGKAGDVVVNVNKKSFWDPRCRELAHKNIDVWLQKNVEIPWEKGCPPKMVMKHIGSNRFKVSVIK